ncbi:MAG: hypothetical protein RMK15_09425 [Chloroflexota bacterium]|nr:hypothetical protein [Dehalococcoidia bacterium]MDW8047481.1 hypothetical protein [Chloroflexota bacterium]
MEPTACLHLWRYEVEVRTKAVRIARCERCGVTRPIGQEAQPAPVRVA